MLCALLEFIEAPLRILRVSGVGDINTFTCTSPALDIAALQTPLPEILDGLTR